MSNGRDLSFLKNKRKVCQRPFEFMGLYPSSQKGIARMQPCCDSWLSTLGKKSVPEVPLANFSFQEQKKHPFLLDFQESILNGSYKFCDKSKCPFYPLAPIISMDTFKVENLRYTVELSFDKSCNLSCPSCRTSLNVTPSPYFPQVLRNSLQQGAEAIFLNGSGELFMNIGVLEILRNLTREQAPALKDIRIISNATLFNKEQYEKLSPFTKEHLRSVLISLDSITPGVYETLRRGGSLSSTLVNVEFLSALHKSGGLPYLSLAMVIQKANAQEVPAFVEYAEKLGCTGVQLWDLDNRTPSKPVEGVSALEREAITKYLRDKKGNTPLEIVSSFLN